MILTNTILGMCLAAVGAHPKLCNLDLVKSLRIGFLSGVAGSIVYLAFLYREITPLFASISGIISTVLAGFLIVMWVFFRDPKRTTPEDPEAIVSPADGKIVYVREIKKGVVPCAIKGQKNIRLDEITKTDFLAEDDGFIIGISMSILDVHITRAPIEGKAVFLKNFEGSIISPKSWKAEVENPRTTILLQNEKLQLGIIEIGTPNISRVLSFFNLGDILEKGQRIGKITWGSQVDVIVPSKYVNLLVKEGDSVRAGETLLARFKS
jgi:phosphatidylserine decarboxylase